MTECTQSRLPFANHGSREVVAEFSGGMMTSDSGALLLRETDRRMKVLARFSQCFLDRRNPALVQHPVEQMLAQRIYGLALGYEDLNDHEQLRQDPLLKLLAGKPDLKEPLAGKSTLNRMELGDGLPNRYKKITFWRDAIDDLLVQVFLEAHTTAPEQIVLDIDTTDFAIHGEQEGRFYHGYYDHYCYLPLYVFAGEHVLCARLRPSNIDPSAGSRKEIERIVRRIRTVWPEVKIVLRGDSGFCREELMAWCEANQVDYVFGMARNARLTAEIAVEMAAARATTEKTAKAARRFKDFRWSTLDSWSRIRRVIGKAEWTEGKANPRFIVTSLPAAAIDARRLYERIYCARGDMENRIKECQLDLFADRTSAATMRANQLRLWFASFAYVLLCALRRIGLAFTQFAR